MTTGTSFFLITLEIYLVNNFIKHILLFCITNVHVYDPIHEYFKIIEYSIGIFITTFSNAHLLYVTH